MSYPNNPEYSKYKNNIKRDQNKCQISKVLSITKAILYNKYKYSSAKIVLKKRNNIRVYEVAINYKFNRKIYNVKYEGKWQRLYYISEQLIRDGLVYGFKHIKKHSDQDIIKIRK